MRIQSTKDIRRLTTYDLRVLPVTLWSVFSEIIFLFWDLYSLPWSRYIYPEVTSLITALTCVYLTLLLRLHNLNSEFILWLYISYQLHSCSADCGFPYPRKPKTKPGKPAPWRCWLTLPSASCSDNISSLYMYIYGSYYP